MPAVLLLALPLLSGCAGAKTQDLAKPAPPPLEYLGAWGRRGDAPGQLLMPLGIATDAAGNAYIAQSGNGFIQKFDRHGTPLLAFQDAVISRPISVAVDRGGAIYVTDLVHSAVGIFLPDGTRFRASRGSSRFRFRLPVGIAVNDGGDYYVLELDAHRVQKFSPSGRFLLAWGKKGRAAGEFLFPRAIAVGADGGVYVADAEGSRVQKFTKDGALLWATGEPGPVHGESGGVLGLAVSATHVFLASCAERGARVWSTEGRFERADNLGNHFDYPASQCAPSAVAVSPAGELLVLDPVADRVLRFRMNF
jgi:DNA-binding beta-propeller fold protein YncE